MSANSTPKLEIEGQGKLNDPTGQYACAYARARKAKQIPSSPTLDPCPSPHQLDRQRRRDSRRQAPSPDLETLLASGMPRRQIESGRLRSRNHIISPIFVPLPRFQLPPYQKQERNRENHHNDLEGPSQDFMNCQIPAVARVVDCQLDPYQYSGIVFDSDVHSSTSHPQCLLSSPQYKISKLKQSPPHHFLSTSQNNISGYENSLPQPRSNRPSQRRRSTSAQYEEIEHGGPGSSQELVSYHSEHAEEERTMIDQAQPIRVGSREADSETRVDDGDSFRFIQSARNRAFRVEKSGSNSHHRFSHDTFMDLDNRRQYSPVPGQLPPDEYYNNPGRALSQSRYAGGENNWGISAPPVLVPTEQVTDAALLKRGLKRGKEAKVCKRGYGANDPENIAIVNMYEKDGMNFEQIKNKLNADRVKTGRNPSLSANGVHSRYNRTAPLLFGAEGKVFVPLSQRGGRGQPCGDIPTGKPAWNDTLDTALVLTVKEWEKTKWENIAKMFKEETGVNMEPEACAVRHHMI